MTAGEFLAGDGDLAGETTLGAAGQPEKHQAQGGPVHYIESGRHDVHFGGRYEA